PEFGPAMSESRPESQDTPHLAGLQDLLCTYMRRGKPLVMADHQEFARHAGCIDHFPGLFYGCCYRLFTQYVLACPESGYRYRCMVLVRGTPAYRIDFAVRKKFLYGMVNLASILLSQFPGPLSHRIIVSNDPAVIPGVILRDMPCDC